MWPRRSAVSKCLGVLAAVCTAMYMLLSLALTPPGSQSPLETAWESWQLLNIDQHILRAQLRELTSELNVTYDATNKSSLEIFRYMKELRNQLPVNPHKFRFTILPRADVCADRLFLLVYVHTAPQHHRRRAAIRDTWGNPRLLLDTPFRVLFLMGRPTNHTVQAAVELESDLHGDIVQEDFVDSYRNLTYKAVMGLRWVSQHCGGGAGRGGASRLPLFLLKTDDDVFVNIFNVASHLQAFARYGSVPAENATQWVSAPAGAGPAGDRGDRTLQQAEAAKSDLSERTAIGTENRGIGAENERIAIDQTTGRGKEAGRGMGGAGNNVNLGSVGKSDGKSDGNTTEIVLPDRPPQRSILCLVWYHMKVVRDPKSKWYIPHSEFSADFFPTYCSGSAFVLSGDLAAPLYAASLRVPFFWVDDFYVTGLLAGRVGARHHRLNSLYALSPRTFLEKFTELHKWRTLAFGHVHNLDWWHTVWGNVFEARGAA